MKTEQKKCMNAETIAFLNLSTKPARLTMVQVAAFLGFQPHDIPVLVAAGLLKVLGKPPKSGTKYFAAVEIQNLWSDVKGCDFKWERREKKDAE